MPVRHLKLVVLALAVVVVCGFAQAQTAATKPAGDAQSGKRVFASAGCATCHGAQAQGTAMAPQISPPPLALPAMIAYARQPTGKMPPVPVATASDAQLADVYAFLLSVAPKTAEPVELKGDAENGKKLFTSYGCYECHGRLGQGGAGPRIGPPQITTAAVMRYVRRPTGQMPPYTDKVVSDQDLADIVAYLKSMPAPPAASTIPLLNQ